MFRKGRRIHFVGIGGIGMSGIAEVLINQGYRVSGSDLSESASTRRLASLGAEVQIGHKPENVGDAFVVVISSAVKEDNPEVVSAHQKMIPVIPRAEMLAELMHMKYAVAVAGSHGKTTTTSLVASVLYGASLDPTVVVGGKLSMMGGSNARMGQGKFLVAEADESDGSFLCLTPTVAVITNIDREHMDHYKTEEAMENAFVDFANKVPFYGAVIICLDDPRIRELMPRFTRRTVTYGVEGQADVSARNIRLKDGRTRFEVFYDGDTVGEIDLCLPGLHHVCNALAAFAVGIEMDVSPAEIIKALDNFSGVDRRSQIKGEARGVLVMDDYAHHPTEVQALLTGLRGAYERRIVAVFQPHRYSRTQDLMERFNTAFYSADVLIVTDIYAAGEEPLPGVNSEVLAEGIRAHGHREVHYIGELDELADKIEPMLKEGDLVVTMGAGSIWQVSERLLNKLGGTDDG
jgi:UDP-N-acetylmuramate--alanine ligase